MPPFKANDLLVFKPCDLAAELEQCLVLFLSYFELLIFILPNICDSNPSTESGEDCVVDRIDLVCELFYFSILVVDSGLRLR